MHPEEDVGLHLLTDMKMEHTSQGGKGGRRVQQGRREGERTAKRLARILGKLLRRADFSV